MTLRRKPLRAVSKKRAAERSQRTKVVENAKKRYGICLLYTQSDCRGPIVGHELVKRSATKDPHLNEDLVVTLCAHHNSWVEDHPKEAQRMGVSIPGWVWRMHGKDALDEAARLRAVSITGKGPLDPFWF